MEDNKDFIHEHPLMTTGAALTAGLLAPIGWNMYTQNSTKTTEDADPQSPQAGKTATVDNEQPNKIIDSAAIQDLIDEHPLMVTGAALAVGLLAPIGLSMLAQNGTDDADNGDKATSDKVNGKKTNQDFIH